MGYEGERMLACPAGTFDFRNTYQRYLKESQKTEIRRFTVAVPNADAAQDCQPGFCFISGRSDKTR
jgi:hypothetical protein